MILIKYSIVIALSRYVDRNVWMSVGRSWVDMMLDMTTVENEETFVTGGNEVPRSNTGLKGVFETTRDDHMECLNSSFGSYHGEGGVQDRESQEVNLELQVTRLQHQVVKP